MARSNGIKYIHLPISYGGAARDGALRIAAAAMQARRPVYVHCHHGKHRGPAAVAIIGKALEGWNTRQAMDWLALAGTDPAYQGLFRMVTNFSKPSAGELSAIGSTFPESSRGSGLVEAMTEIDRWFNRLRKERACLDMEPAVLLAESFRELERNLEPGKFPSEFRALLRQAAENSEKLRETLPSTSGEKAGDAWNLIEEIGSSCADCHKKFRD